MQDDWDVFGRIDTAGLRIFCEQAFVPHDRLFYRPLAHVQLALQWTLFGSEGWAQRLVNWSMFAGAAFLAGSVAQRLTRNAVVGAVVTITWSSAVAIHVDTTIWAVGVYMLGSALFGLAALRLFLGGHRWATAIVLLAGMGYSESAATAGLIALGIAWLEPRRCGLTRRQALRNWIPIGTAIAGWLALRSAGVLWFDLPVDHPYAARPLGPHLGSNAVRYAAWCAQGLIPIPMPRGIADAVLTDGAASMSVAAVVSLPPLRRSLWRLRAVLLVHAVWTALALGPALLLVDHCFPYYAT